MWFLRKPRKLLLLVLTGCLLWASVSYFASRIYDRSARDHQSVAENAYLSQYDEIVPENVVVKRATERVRARVMIDHKFEKSKLDEAVHREEENNRIKHEQLKQELNRIGEERPKSQLKNEFKFEKSKFEEIINQEQIDNHIKRKHLKHVLNRVGVLKEHPVEPNDNVVPRQQPVVDDNQAPVTVITTRGPLLNIKNKDSESNQVEANSDVLLSADKKPPLTGDVLQFGHNESVSQVISLRRTLPDVRDPLCKNVDYPSNLPDVSVIIAFYNEAWTTLLRTVHSVLDRSPSHLIREVILIDDFSSYEHLQQQLRDYTALLPKVVVRRTTSRVGVITARQIGASVAVGEVLVFLDSHCECTIGWLEPLLARIRDGDNHVVTPVMDIVDDKTFEYRSFDAKSINVGGFDWNLQFIWIGITERVKKLQKTEIDFIQSPTMPGGMFAISKNFFNKLGGFDPGMDMWGAENLEMSFKIWMCGGTLETVPCSHVGHLFRHGASYKLGRGDPQKNYFRLAEVWLDEYKDLFYQKIGKGSEISEDDIASRKTLRRQLQCKTFGWYLNNVYPELFIPTQALADGEIRNKVQAFADGVRFPGCLDAAAGQNGALVKIWPCHNQGGNQQWMLSTSGEIRRDDSCMDFSGNTVVILPCHGQKGNQVWMYGKDKSIKHVNSKLCMALSPDGGMLAMSPCSGKSNQMWHWRRKTTGDKEENKTDDRMDEENRIQPNDNKKEDDNKLLQEIAVDNY